MNHKKKSKKLRRRYTITNTEFSFLISRYNTKFGRKFGHLEQYIQVISNTTQSTNNPIVIEPIEIPKVKRRRGKTRQELSNEKHKCLICHNEIIGRKNIVQHYLAHTDETIKRNKEAAKTALQNGQFQCSTCLEEFLTNTELQNHENHYHTERKYMCPICNKCFIVQKYREHIAKHETPDKDQSQPNEQFTCEICGAHYHHKIYLIKHINKVHSNPRTFTFQCKICFKEYTNKPFLKHHINKTHLGIQVDTRVCDICGKTISEKKYVMHKKIHEDARSFACTYCNKRFNLKRYLNEHMRTHTGQRPYICQYCGKAFSQKSPLNIHLRSHTGETPYVCLVCNRGFVVKSLLDNHIKNDEHSLEMTLS